MESTSKKTTENGLFKLQQELVEIYEGLTPLMPPSACDTPTQLFSLFNITASDHGTENSKLLTINQLLWPPEKRILVQARARFGKTTLCYVLTRWWTTTCHREDCPFKLCLLCRLNKREINSGIEELLFEACANELSSQVVETTLTEYSDKILVLLDGYDQLPTTDQKKVISFLHSSEVFKESTVLVTTRPSSDKDFVNVFERHAFIRGLSAECLTKLLPQQEHWNVFADQKLNHLTELSPHFTSLVAEALRRKPYYIAEDVSLFCLLEYTIQHLFSQKGEKSFPPDHVHTLGKKLYLALLSGKTSFAEEDLRRTLGEDHDKFIKWNIFYRQREDRDMLSFSNPVLQVFFATMYLRNRWKCLSNDLDRITFMKNILCRGCCCGDYVTSVGGALYFVGIIPEVLVKFGTTRSLEGSTIEMCYDVDGIAKSRAFDSLNLISRLCQKHIERFGFTALPKNDEAVEERFDGVLDCFCVGDCTVDYHLLVNDRKEATFMKISKEGEEPNALKIALVSRNSSKSESTDESRNLHGSNNPDDLSSPDVSGSPDDAKTSFKTERVLIDFVYSEFEDVFEIVNSLLSRYCKPLCLPADTKTASPAHFVAGLLQQICSSEATSSATVTCGSDKGGSVDRLVIEVSNPSLDDRENRLLSVNSALGSYELKIHKLVDEFILKDACSTVTRLVSKCQLNVPGLRIRINFF